MTDDEGSVGILLTHEDVATYQRVLDAAARGEFDEGCWAWMPVD